VGQIVTQFTTAVLTAAIYSSVIYLACGFLFNLDILKKKLSNDIKAVIALILSGLFVWYSGFDMLHLLGVERHWGGQVISALVLAGGSRGILKLVRKVLKSEDSPIKYEQSAT